MAKITKGNLKKFWEDHKEKILIIGGSAICITVGLIGYHNRLRSLKQEDSDEFEFFHAHMRPSREIPKDINEFKITEIGDDYANSGCIVWLEDCKLSNCGKFGEGLTKIEHISPEMEITMAILAKK